MLKRLIVALLVFLCAASASAGFWYLAGEPVFKLRSIWDQAEWDESNWE